MWQSKGRSGYGDSTLQGDYDDWQGLSRNGRQWKSEATHLTRSLSGHDYWHLRKQIRPTEEIPQDMYAVNDTANLAHTLPNGKANLLAYADPAPVRKSVSKVSIEDKILPQKKRLNTLRSQMLELEQSYRNKEMSVEKYSLLRDIVVAKIERQEVLYKRAASVKPKSEETDEDGLEYTPSSGFSTQDDDGYGLEEYEEIGVVFVDTLSSTNSLKKPLKNICKLVKGLVRFISAARNYINELRAL